MNDPIKIIHNYKHNNNKVQYKVNIFIGYQVPTSIYEILKYIEYRSLYNTLIDLNTSQILDFENFYGDNCCGRAGGRQVFLLYFICVLKYVLCMYSEEARL